MEGLQEDFMQAIIREVEEAVYWGIPLESTIRLIHDMLPHYISGADLYTLNRLVRDLYEEEEERWGLN